MQIRSVMTSYCLQLKSVKYWINDISGNIEAVLWKLGTINVHHKRNKMTPLVLLPWQQLCRWWCVNKNKNFQFCLETKTIYATQSNDGSEENMGTMSVSSRTLCLSLEVANGEFIFLAERDWSQNSCHGNSTKGVILFLLWCTFMMPSFKNTASIFPEISLIQYFPLFTCSSKQYDVITDLICIIEKCPYF